MFLICSSCRWEGPQDEAYKANDQLPNMYYCPKCGDKLVSRKMVKEIKLAQKEMKQGKKTKIKI